MQYFKVIWRYLKKDKWALFGYIFLVVLSYLPHLFSPMIWGVAIEHLMEKDFSSFVLLLAIWEGLYIFLYTILQIPRDKLYYYLEVKFSKNVSKDLYHKMMNLPAIAFEDVGIGEFTNRLYTDPDRVIELLAKLIRMTCKSVVVIGILIVTFRISLLLGFEILLFAFLMGFISMKFFPRIKKTQEKIKKESDDYVKTLTENITGIREIKGLGIKKNIEKRTFSKIDALFLHTKEMKNVEVIYYALNNFAYFSLQFLLLYSLGKYFVAGKITFSLFSAVESYLWRIDEVVESLSDFGVNYNKVVVSLKRIDELMGNRLYQDEYFGNKTLEKSKGMLTFDHVSFRYREEEKLTLNGLSLSIAPRKKVAIVGKSGNGKSTLFNLLLRYFDPTTGKILLDGIPLCELSEETLRNTISIIRQTTFLFNLSIFENFQIVKEDVTLEEVKKVCKKAYIDQYIESLPNQYDTVIGEGGVNLSGGQKQRLAIARTLLLNTKVILFDEATSALDNESQECIKKTIDQLVKNHTIIIVAHRLSTIVDADVIHIIDKGKLAGSGTHEELLKTNAIYQSLYTRESMSEMPE